MRFLTIYRHWFECFGSTKHISTWQNICEQLGVDDDPENIDKLIVSVSRCRYDVFPDKYSDDTKIIRKDV